MYIIHNRSNKCMRTIHNLKLLIKYESRALECNLLADRMYMWPKGFRLSVSALECDFNVLLDGRNAI